MKKFIVFNKTTIEEIEIGMILSYSQAIKKCDIKVLFGMSGDINPAHLFKLEY